MELLIGFILGCATILTIKTYNAFKEAENNYNKQEEPKAKQKVVRDDYDDDEDDDNSND